MNIYKKPSYFLLFFLLLLSSGSELEAKVEDGPGSKFTKELYKFFKNHETYEKGKKLKKKTEIRGAKQLFLFFFIGLLFALGFISLFLFGFAIFWWIFGLSLYFLAFNSNLITGLMMVFDDSKTLKSKVFLFFFTSLFLAGGVSLIFLFPLASPLWLLGWITTISVGGVFYFAFLMMAISGEFLWKKKIKKILSYFGWGFNLLLFFGGFLLFFVSLSLGLPILSFVGISFVFLSSIVNTFLAMISLRFLYILLLLSGFAALVLSLYFVGFGFLFLGLALLSPMLVALLLILPIIFLFGHRAKLNEYKE